MKSYTDLKSLFKTLSMNTSSSNDSLAGILINDQHRYLLMRFFDNERSFTMTTVGNQVLTATVSSGTTAVASGGTNATLSVAWPSTSVTVTQLVNFTNGEQRNVTFTQGSTTISWQSPLTSSAGTTVSCVGVQAYPIPANVSKIKNPTITIGQLVYSPAPVSSIQEWTRLNALPYNSSIPAYFYIYNNQLLFWPIPSTSGNIITLNCQVSVPDMTYENNTTGTILSMVAGSNAVTGSATTFSSGGSVPTGTDLTFVNLYITANPPKGDGVAYQVQSVTSDTALTTLKPVVNSPNTTGATLLLGQYPLLAPDFHDMLVYGALRTYFSSIVKDPDRFTLYDRLYNERMELMKFYLGTKSVNVDLSVTPIQSNPNLYTFGTNP